MNPNGERFSMHSNDEGINSSAEFFYKAKMMVGMGTSVTQEYGKGYTIVERESITFNPIKETKVKGGMKGNMLRSLASTNIHIYPNPVMQYRDIKEIRADKKKELNVVMHEPYSVNPLTGKEMLAMPNMKTEMILLLKFDDNEIRDQVKDDLISKWSPLRRSEAEVGFGTTSPTEKPVTITRAEGSGKRFCSMCGEALIEGHRFCGKCGAAV